MPVLEKLGISNYDEVPSMDKLVFTMREALETFKEKWQTIDVEEIKKKIRFCVMREMVAAEGRKDAKEYNKRKPIFDFDLEETFDPRATQMSGSKMGSISPSKKPGIMSGRMSAGPTNRKNDLSASNMVSIGGPSQNPAMGGS